MWDCGSNVTIKTTKQHRSYSLTLNKNFKKIIKNDFKLKSIGVHFIKKGRLTPTFNTLTSYTEFYFLVKLLTVRLQTY